MQFAKISRAFALVAVLALTSAVASADVWNKKTTLTVKETIEVPGAVLTPGEYVVKLVDSQSNRHIVQFLNKEENEVLSTVIAIPNMRLKSTGDTQFEWYETPAGQPPALRAWFYPGDTFGQEFAYPEGRATELAAATKQEVAHVSDQEAAAAQQAPKTEETVIAQAPATDRQAAERAREREIAAQRERDMQAQRDRERQLAQAEQNQQRIADPNLTAQQTPQSQPAGNELPETAGFGALLALIGLGSLGASRAVRKLRNK